MDPEEIQPESDLCESCRYFHLTQILETRHNTLLGPLESIFSRPECALCRLITNIFLRPWVDGGYSKEIIASEAQDSTMGLCYITGAQELNAKSLALAVSTARFPGGVGPPEPLLGSIYLTSGGNFDPSLERSKVARLLKPKINFELIQEWLTDCDKSHHECVRVGEQNWQRMPSNFRLIDIHRRCLVKTAQRLRYIALSYVWGASSSLKTTKSTIHQFSMDQAFDKSKTKLPALVESAIEFSESLSERYLWVDALCIVQDDDADVSDQISKMDAIYSCSYITLVAAAGTSSQSRLLGLPSSPRVVKQTVEMIQGNSYIAEPSTLDYRLSETIWNTRGWTYQERELSSRRVFVFDDECFFECGRCIRCESLMLATHTPQRSWWTRMEKPSLNTPSIDLAHHNNQFLVYFFNNVNEYTTRKLTKPEDISNAFAGLCTSIQNNGHTRIISGMPVENLHQAMFWEITGISARRLSTFSHQGSTWIFPSWSWIGWVGAIQYKPSRTNSARLEIDETIIQIQKQVIDQKWL